MNAVTPAIDASGNFDTVTHAQYHTDPCAHPSLSCSIAKLLIGRTPAHAHRMHARFAAPT